MHLPVLAAVDIGGTKVTASISNADGILAKVYQETVKTGDNTALPIQVDGMISAVCRLAGVKKAEVNALGVSTCSPFERRDGKLVLVSPNLCGGLTKDRHILPNRWMDIPLDAELRKHYPETVIGNDCITAVVAERLFGAGIGEDNLLYVTWSTGIGAGAYVDGHLLCGKNANALHLGHTFITTENHRQPACGCGDRGHLEAFAAGPAIARDFAEATGDRIAPVEVFRLYRQGNKTARGIIQRAARIFARGLVNATALLDTRLIVLGGSVIKDWDVLEPLVQEEFASAFPPLTKGVTITLSRLSQYLGDIAALSLVMPESWIPVWKAEKPWEKTPKAVKLET
jgi:glucokinase